MAKILWSKEKAEQIKQFRQKRGLTQEDAARVFGFTIRTLCRLENCEINAIQKGTDALIQKVLGENP